MTSEQHDYEVNRAIELLEEERKRLARDIHDGPAQSFTNITMRLEIIRRLLESNRSDDALQELDRLQGFTRTATNDIRRLIFDLRPTFLERGVIEAIRLYCQRFTQATGLDVTVEGDWSSVALPRPTEVGLFRICQESLNNVQKHAAASHVTVSLSETESEYVLLVHDNGKGFDMTLRSGASSYGMQGMQERMALVGGTVSVSSALGQGTTVQCEVPKIHDK